MAELRGMRQVEQAMTKVVRESLRTRVSAYITRELRDRLFAQKQVDGSPFPKKFQTKTGDKVRKQYERKGWDTEHFYIRTGESYPLQTKTRGTTLEVYPKGYETLAYNKDRVQWIGLTDEDMRRIIEIISEDLRDEFRN